MSDKAEKMITGPGEPAPEGSVSGTPIEGKRAPDLERTMERMATTLKRDFAQRIADDAKGFKKAAVHLLKQYLPPGPGRLPELAITRAIQLHSLCWSWQDIYPACIPAYAGLGRAERRLAESNLRAARRSRLNARKRRSRRPSRLKSN
jgi:hypothetical protein